ncbi:uncharacterized protein LOC144077073 [Stigmatopora argus]
MSDLEKLTLAFQAQLLDVLESVVKSTMYKITELVEHGFLEEVKRRNQELETLRMKLEHAEIRLSDLDVNKRKANGTFLDIASDGNGNTSEEWLVVLQGDVLMSCSGQTKIDSTERLTGRQLCVRESEADEPPAFLNPAKEERNSEEHAIVMPTVDVKKENEEGSDSLSETMKADVLSNNNIETDLHILNACNNPEGLETSDTPTDILVKAHTNQMGIRPHQHRVRPDEECNTAETNCSSQQAIQQVDYMTQTGTSRDQLSPSQSSIQRPLNAVSLSVSIKQEVFLSSDDGVDNQQVNMVTSTKPVFPCAVKQMSNSQNSQIPESLQHSEDVTCNRLLTPMKKLPKTLSNSRSGLSRTRSQASNVDPLNRNPSTLNSTQSPSSNSHRSYILSHPNCQPDVRHSHCCGQCGKYFSHRSNLKAHLETHTGVRPFCCSLCGRSFSKLSNLKAHHRIHTGERPYSCLACGKRFTQKFNLKRHQSTHVFG